MLTAVFEVMRNRRIGREMPARPPDYALVLIQRQGEATALLHRASGIAERTGLDMRVLTLTSNPMQLFVRTWSEDGEPDSPAGRGTSLEDYAYSPANRLLVVGRDAEDSLMPGGYDALLAIGARVLIVNPSARSRGRQVVAAVDDDRRCFAAVSSAVKDGVVEGDLVFLHSFRSSARRMTWLAGASSEEIETAARREAQELRTRVGDMATEYGLSGRIDIMEGDPSDSLSKALSEIAPATLILGRSGRSRVGRFLTGSITSQMIRRSNADVLLV